MINDFSNISNLAKILAAEYGRGFTYSGLTRMVKFYEQISEAEIVATLSQQLTGCGIYVFWS